LGLKILKFYKLKIDQ